MSTLTFPALLFLITAAFLLPLISSYSNPCNKADMHNLLKIKKSLGNPSELISWNSSNADNCCWSWPNVFCNGHRRVTYVDIIGINLTGPLPESISSLSALTGLRLESVPDFVGPIPPFLTKLTKLNQLTIKSTALSGEIPSILTKLPNLEYLDLSDNRLTGNIPPFLRTLTNLSYLDLSQNNLNGNIPPSFLPPVKEYPMSLILNANNLYGKIPRSFAKIRFSILDLSHNKLTGDDSGFLGGRNAFISRINFAWNELAFDLSKVQFPEGGLLELNLSHNQIRGSIPQQISKLTMLSSLDLSYNRLCGPIPELNALAEMGPSVYEHNKCLCEAPLSACRRSSP